MFERTVRIVNKDELMNNPNETPISGDTLEEQVISALRAVYDPEIPVNIYDLGLIYSLDIRDDNSVHIGMTLTAPACPVAGSMPGAVARAVERVPGIGPVAVELVWDPPWTPERMSDEARLELGMM
jgi:FeS assembly SUF system protein